MIPRIFIDANVLYSALLRDFLLRLAVEDVCHVHWSADVQNEWKKHLINNSGYSEVIIDRTQMRMNLVFPEAEVRGYVDMLDQIALPDSADRHVLAAAVTSRSSFIITFNLKDFPSEILKEYSVQALHPDDFILELITKSPDGVGRALEKLITSLKSPPITLKEFAISLQRLDINKSANKIIEIYG